jgi:hypothetical protein
MGHLPTINSPANFGGIIRLRFFFVLPVGLDTKSCSRATPPDSAKGEAQSLLETVPGL